MTKTSLVESFRRDHEMCKSYAADLLRARHGGSFFYGNQPRVYKKKRPISNLVSKNIRQGPPCTADALDFLAASSKKVKLMTVKKKKPGRPKGSVAVVQKERAFECLVWDRNSCPFDAVLTVLGLGFRANSAVELLVANAAKDVSSSESVAIVDHFLSFQASIGTTVRMEHFRKLLRDTLADMNPSQYPFKVSDGSRHYEFADSTDVMRDFSVHLSATHNLAVPPTRATPTIGSALYSVSGFGLAEGISNGQGVGEILYANRGNSRQTKERFFARDHIVLMLPFRDFQHELNESRTTVDLNRKERTEIVEDINARSREVQNLTLPLRWNAPVDDDTCTFEFCGGTMYNGSHFQSVFVVESGIRGANVEAGLYFHDGMKNGGKAIWKVPLRQVQISHYVHDIWDCWRGLLRAGGVRKWDAYVPDMVLYRRLRN